MHVNELWTAVKKQPFEPFNIVMSGGEKYPVNHSENMTLTKNSVVIPIHSRSTDGRFADEVVFASYLHVTALEPLSLSRPRRRK